MTLHPSFPKQRPLSGASGCIGSCLLLFVTSVTLLPLPSLSYFPISLLYVHLSFPILFLSNLVSLSPFLPLLFSQTSWPAVHPDRVSTAVCAKLSCSSRGGLHSLRRGALSQHLGLLSSQHPWPKLDLDTKTTCFYKNLPHTLHKGNLEKVKLDKCTGEYKHNL